MKKLNKKRVIEFASFIYVLFFISTIFFIERTPISIFMALLSIPLTFPAFNFVEKYVSYLCK